MTLLHVREHVVHHRGGPARAGLDVAPALSALDLPDPGGVWLIRLVDVRVATPTGTRAGTTAAVLARQIHRAVRRVLEAGPDGDDVRWFPDRPAFLAAWLVDLGRDRAADRWEYAGLGALPLPAAVRARAGVEPADLLAALRAMPAAELDRLVALLTPADAFAVAETITRDGRDPGIPGVARAVAALRDAGRLPDDARRATLAVLVALGRSAGGRTAAATRHLVSIAHALRAVDPHHREALVAALRSADVRTIADAGRPDLAAALPGWSPADRSAAVDALGAVPPRAVADSDHTGLGGLFLLLPLLGELPLAAACDGWPDGPSGAEAAAVVAALAIGAVLGPGTTVLADPWVRLALGLPDDVADGIVGWSTEVLPGHLDRLVGALGSVLERRADAVAADRHDPSLLLAPPLAPVAAEAVRLAAAALLRELSHRLPGMALASPGHLRRNVLALDATVRTGADGIHVRLGRAPLALLLSLTGMDRRRFVLDATGDRPWVLTPPA